MNKAPLCHIGCDKGGITLDGIYDITRGGEKIGRAEVKREGLYYRFRCCCNLTGEVIYRITVTCSGRTENIGIPVPEGDCFRLNTRLPVSRFQAGEPEFRAVPRHPETPKTWAPVIPETPFEYITRLENAVAEERDGQIGILMAPEIPVPQDNGQSQEYPNE